MWHVPSFAVLYVTAFLNVVSLINAQGFRQLHAFDEDDGDGADDGTISSAPPSSTRNWNSSMTSKASFIQQQSALNRTSSGLESALSASPSSEHGSNSSISTHDSLGQDRGGIFDLPSASVAWAEDSQCTSSWVSKLGAVNMTLQSTAKLTYSVVPETGEDPPQFKVFAGGKQVNSVWNDEVCCGNCFVRYPTVSVYYWPVKNEQNTWCLKYLSESMTGAASKAPSTTVDERTRTEAGADVAATLSIYSVLSSQQRTLSAATRTQLQVLDPTSVVERITTTPSITPAPVLAREQPANPSDYHKYIPRSFIPLHDNDTIPALGINGTGFSNSSVVYAVADDGFVFISPSVYVVYSTVTARNKCGPFGPEFTSLTFAYAENELSSIDAVNRDTRPYNFADLPCPPKTWAFDGQVPNPLMGHERALGDAVRAYHPYILGPAKRLRHLDPLWSSCIVWDVGNGYDPPRTLEPHTAMINPQSKIADPQDPIPAPDPKTGQGQPNIVDPPASPPSQVHDAGRPKEDAQQSDAKVTKAPPVPAVDPSALESPPVEPPLNYPAKPAENHNQIQQASSIDPHESSSPPPPQPAFAPATPDSPITQVVDAPVVIHGQTITPDAPPVRIDGSNVAVSGGSIHVDGSSAKVPQVQVIYNDAPSGSGNLALVHAAKPPNNPHTPHGVVAVGGFTFSTGLPQIEKTPTQGQGALKEGQPKPKGNNPDSSPNAAAGINEDPVAPHYLPGDPGSAQIAPIGQGPVGDPPRTSLTLGTVGGQVISADATHAVVNGQTLTAGAQPIDIAGTKVNFEPSALRLGNEMIPLPPREGAQDLVPLATLGGQPIIGDSNLAVIGGQTISRGGLPVTIAGTRVSLGDSAIQVGSETIQLARQQGETGIPLPPGEGIQDLVPLATLGGQPIIGDSNIAVVGGPTISRGGPPVTIAGTRVSLGDNAIQVGSETIQLAGQSGETGQPNAGPSSSGKQTADSEQSHLTDETATSIGLTNPFGGSNTMSLDALSGSETTYSGRDGTTKSSGATPPSMTSIAGSSFGTAGNPPSVPTTSKKSCGGLGVQPARLVKTIALAIVIVGLTVVVSL